MRTDLPVNAKREEIMSALRRHRIAIIAGETGCGKTTLVPRFILEDGFGGAGTVGVTEPRRIAAVGVATYVASQVGCLLGDAVGYQIRHRNVTDPARTRLKYMTEGILLREMLADPELRKYDALVLDEVHERNVNQDLLLALAKDLLGRRSDLIVAVMSATIDEARFSRYFSAPIVRVEGRAHPVSIEHLDRDPDDFVAAAVEKTRELLRRTSGDVLIFMPDYDSIRAAMELLADSRDLGGAGVLPLFGNQSPEEQALVFSRTGRHVIVSTNVAETSVTLDGVTAVVDTGKIKEMRYLPSRAMSTLKVAEHSRAGCIQRAGRAGRTAPGICARLFTARNFARRPEFTEPEIDRVALDQVLLQLTAMGMTDEEIASFDFLSPPAPVAWEEARESLQLLGARSDDGALTDVGRLMSEIPLPPAITRMVLSARRYGCVKPVVTIAASFSTRPVFTRPPGREDAADDAHRRFRHPCSDFLTLLNAVRAWRAAGDGRTAFAEANFLHPRALEEIEATEVQIADILEEHGIERSQGNRPEDIGRAVASGLIANLLMQEEGKRIYKTRRHNAVFVFPGSSVFDRDPQPRYAVAAEIIETTRAYARGVQEVHPRWLKELLPDERPRKKKGCRRDRYRPKKKRRQR